MPEHGSGAVTTVRYRGILLECWHNFPDPLQYWRQTAMCARRLVCAFLLPLLYDTLLIQLLLSLSETPRTEPSLPGFRPGFCDVEGSLKFRKILYEMFSTWLEIAASTLDTGAMGQWQFLKG